MNNDERKSRLHIHTGGLIILAIIIFILFKVDIREKIESPQFQKNYTYIEENVKIFWQKYISGPVKSKLGSVFIDFTNKELEKVQENFSKNVLKTEGIDKEMQKYEIE
ncbi:MAG TPA: hypothetical protein VK153_00560 [Candidatus Paceibacterota bacterium]|nr:hypothetical protein [Candidatus Paceibacterota bacterium]